MNGATPHIVFSGGGTGGHLFPGLAVAEQLRIIIPRARITFAGSDRDFERQHVAKAGFDYLGLPCRPIERSPLRAARSFAAQMSGYRMARRFLTRERASLVVGLGGYASVPAARAAAKLHLPLVLLEQNVISGRANRFLAASARLICTSFAETDNHWLTACPIRLTGTPVRQGIAELARTTSAPNLTRRTVRRILVVGGSRGSRSLNEAVPLALYHLGRQLASASPPARLRIMHQTGAIEAEGVSSLYQKLGLDAVAVPFIEDMASALATADLVIARAGGATLAEVAAAGIPAVLWPYPYAKDDHQRRNADALKIAGAALVVDQRKVTGRLDFQIAETVAKVITSDRRHTAMSAAMRSWARPDAAWQIASLVRDMLSERPLRAAG